VGALGSANQTVKVTERHVGLIYNHFIGAGTCFILSIILLFWLLVGLPNRIPYDLDDVGSHALDNDETMTEMHDGAWTITCIDKANPDHHHERDLYCAGLAISNTVVIVGMLSWGIFNFFSMRRDYRMIESGSN